jgi:hypothetical protein
MISRPAPPPRNASRWSGSSPDGCGSSPGGRGRSPSARTYRSASSLPRERRLVRRSTGATGHRRTVPGDRGARDGRSRGPPRHPGSGCLGGAVGGEADRVWRALAEFGAPLSSLGITRGDFDHPGPIIQLGLPPSRIDVLTAISGVPDFAAAWGSRSVHEVRGQQVPFLGRAELIVNKRASGRRKDLADLEALGELPPSP